MTTRQDSQTSTGPLRLRSHRRLRYALILSAVIVLGGLALLPELFRVPSPPEPAVLVLQPPPKEISAPETAMPVETPEPEVAQQVNDAPEPADKMLASEEVTTGAEIESADAPPRDWPDLIESIAARSDEFSAQSPSMSPVFDERRRVAATRYSKPLTRAKKPIWENVEIDALGRKILRHGDCYRVIADPSAVRQWEFENFTQFMVFCGGANKSPVQLAFVDPIVERYDYLKRDYRNKSYLPDLPPPDPSNSVVEVAEAIEDTTRPTAH